MEERLCEHGYTFLVCDGVGWFPTACPTCEPLTVDGLVDADVILCALLDTPAA